MDKINMRKLRAKLIEAVRERVGIMLSPDEAQALLPSHLLMECDHCHVLAHSPAGAQAAGRGPLDPEELAMHADGCAWVVWINGGCKGPQPVRKVC